MKSQDLEKYNLPDAPGVYFFIRATKILYIGRATSLKNRVRSYFAKDLIATRGPLIVDMVYKANKISFTESDSLLEALILEANLIKKHQPYYNTKEKDNKSFNYVVITDEDFPRVLIIRGRELESKNPETRVYEIKTIFGPYPQGSTLKEAMKIIRRLFPFRDKCMPNGAHRPCFNRQIGLCPGVCSGEITRQEYARTIKNLTLFFQGRKKELLRNLEIEMKNFAKKQEFERASMARKKIFALNHIQDVALIKQEIQKPKIENGFRIEAYDVAHFAGKEVVGVMTVVSDGELKKSDYRKFKIKEIPGVDDTRALSEVLERRLKHMEWLYPNLIVVDGGVAQVNTAKAVLAKNKIKIEVIGVVKDERHRPAHILGDIKTVKHNKALILLANTEAHRFAITYHRQKRNIVS